MSDHENEVASNGEEPGQSTTFCPFDNIHLSFPTGSALIQCPQCGNTLDPNASHQIRCVGCHCLLAYPPNSQYIQCPKCLNTMDPRHPSASQPSSSRSSDHDGGGGGGGGGNRRHNTSSSTNHAKAEAGSGAPAEPKKRRDPNAPKAVCNAYMIFCKSRRNELKDENPDLPFGKIGAKLGEIWRNMTPEEKKPYDDRAAVDRDRYRREMTEYQAGKGAGEKRQKLDASESHGKNHKKTKKEVKQEEHDDEEEEYDDDE